MKKTLASLMICLMLGAVAAMGASASDMGDRIADTCSQCHSTKRVCKMIGIKDSAAWTKTLTRMVGKGAQLPASDIGNAAAYLDSLAPGTGPVCQ